MIMQGPGITRDQLDEYSTTLHLHAVDLTIPRLKTHPLYVMETLPWRNSYGQHSRLAGDRTPQDVDYR
jgi:hypothetical protein